MSKIAGKIYFDVNTGEVLIHKKQIDSAFNVNQTTYQEDLETYRTLSERNSESFGYVVLPIDAYKQDFRESNGYRVNPDTKELEFSYPDPNQKEPVFQEPLSTQVEGLKGDVFDMDTRLMMLEMGGM